MGEYFSYKEKVTGSNLVINTKIKLKIGMRGLDAAFKVHLKNDCRLIFNFDFLKKFCYNIYVRNDKKTYIQDKVSI